MVFFLNLVRELVARLLLVLGWLALLGPELMVVLESWDPVVMLEMP